MRFQPGNAAGKGRRSTALRRAFTGAKYTHLGYAYARRAFLRFMAEHPQADEDTVARAARYRSDANELRLRAAAATPADSAPLLEAACVAERRADELLTHALGAGQ